MVAASAAHGNERLIGFDMGGTSTDVSHFAGQFELADESLVAGVRVRAPMMRIHTVAAGGGSICSFDGMRFRVGPESAGANPGPACYRNGGPLTVTDCNLALGKIDPERFPRVFGQSGDSQPLDRDASIAAASGEMADSLGGRQGRIREIAEGFLDIAVDNMAAAIRKISIARGHDVTRYTLACFGGAGGQLACRVADALGMERILIHPLAGVLSAYGIGIADVKAIREVSWLKPLEADFPHGRLRALEEQALCGSNRPGPASDRYRLQSPRPPAHRGKRHHAGNSRRAARANAGRVRGPAQDTLRLLGGRCATGHHVDALVVEASWRVNLSPSSLGEGGPPQQS